jgi:hypothetical protein
MADDKKILIDITIDTDALEKSRDKAILAVAGFDKKLAEMKTQRKKDLEELSKAVESGNQKEIDAINKRTIAAEAETKSIQQSRRDQLKVVTLSNDLITQSDGKTLQSKEQLRKARGLEQIQLDQLKGTLKENADGQIVLSEAGERSVEQLNKYNTGLITFGKSANDGRENVGNYTNSILEAVDKTGLFGTSLGTVKEAFNAVRSGAASASDGIKKFKEGVSQSVSIVTEWAQSGRVAGEVTDTSTAQVGKLGGALDGAGKSGVSAGNAIKGALASTGIGLLVIVLASVINYLRQVEPVVEKVEQIFAGLGATVTAIGQTFFELGKIIFNAGSFLVDFVLNPMEAISNISLDGIFDGFLGAAKNITTAGVAAANLVKQTQELEDAERLTRLEISKNNIVAEKNRALSEDRTRSAKERLGFLQLAQDAEKKNLEIELRNKEKALKLIQLELHEKQKLGTISDELADRAIAQVNEVSELRARLANKDISDAAEASKKKLQDQKAYLQGVIALLNEELRTAELQGFATIELKKEVLKKQRDAELKESELSYEQRLAIEKKYQNDLLELDIETAKKREDIRKQSNQIAIDGIIDGQTRELAALSLALDEKLEAIEGNSNEERELRAKLIERGIIDVLAIEKKYAELSQQEKQKIAENDRNLLSAENEKKFKDAENRLKLSLSRQEISQEEYDFRVFKLKEEFLQKEIDFDLKLQAHRQSQDQLEFERARTALVNKLIAGEISQEEFNKRAKLLQDNFYKTQGETELATAADIITKANELDQLRVDNAIATNAKIVEDDERTKELRKQIKQEELNLARTAIDGFIEILGMDEKARKEHAVAIKALTISSMLVGLNAEIGGYWLGAAADSKDGIIVKGSAAAILATQRSIQASIRTAVGIAKVAAQKFEDGGYSAPDMVKRYNPTFTNNPKGYINKPTAWMNLAGEAGGEWIASNRLLQDPRTAPVIQSLENFQRTGALTFATGGFTTPFVIPNSVGASANDIAMAVKLAVSELQITPIVSVQEIIDVNSNMQNVRATATL